MYTYCSHPDITSKYMIQITFGVFQFSCKGCNIRYYSRQASFFELSLTEQLAYSYHKIINSARLWRVGYREVVLGRRKYFGHPKTQLAMFA